MSDPAYDWPWANCWGYKVIQRLWVPVLGCSLERSSCAPRLAFTSAKLKGRSAKHPRYPEIFLCLGTHRDVDTPRSSVRTFAAELFLCILSCHMWVHGQPFLHLCLSYPSQCGFFYKSLVLRLLFSQSTEVQPTSTEVGYSD